MRAALLRNYLIDLYGLTTVRDNYGAEVEEYTLIFQNIRCYISDFHESRSDLRSEMEYLISRTFTMRRHYRSVINEHCRIKYGEAWYQVDSIETSKDNNNIVVRANKVNL